MTRPYRLIAAPFELLFILGSLAVVAITFPLWLPWLLLKVRRHRKEAEAERDAYWSRHVRSTEAVLFSEGTDGPRNSSEGAPPENHAA